MSRNRQRTSTIGSSGGFFPKTALLAVLASKLYFILRFRAERKAIVLFLTVIFIIAKVIRYIKPGLFMIVFHCEQWWNSGGCLFYSLKRHRLVITNFQLLKPKKVIKNLKEIFFKNYLDFSLPPFSVLIIFLKKVLAGFE